MQDGRQFIGQEPDAVTFGQAVATQRIRRHMSQDQLAHEAGVSRSTMQSIEAGRRTSKTSRRLVAQALGVSVIELAGSEPAEPDGAKYTYRVLADGMPGVQLVILSDRPLTDDEQAQAWQSAQKQ